MDAVPPDVPVRASQPNIGKPHIRIDHACRITYCVIRALMDQIQSLQEKVLSGDCETDELYVKAASKGIRLDANGGDRTLPGRRVLPRGSGPGVLSVKRSERISP